MLVTFCLTLGIMIKKYGLWMGLVKTVELIPVIRILFLFVFMAVTHLMCH